ncbi:unnamed protein product [Ilex paraguariensis]|uniref:Cytochrome P450 n=1 Tax=Ilex paraguariensis TaxID=185542 RepID=A0ABC8RJM5_9AQUA
MEKDTCFIIVVLLCISALFKPLFNLIFVSSSSSINYFKERKKKKLPPGPPSIPVIGNLLWLLKSFSEIEPILRDLRVKYGPLITLEIGSRPAIFVASHSIAHQALIQNGAVFSDRPRALATSKIMSSNQHNISSAAYGSTWRLLRRNLTFEILHPSRVKSYSPARRWVLGILINGLLKSAQSESVVRVVDHFQYAMFCLLVLMCFGDKLDENQIKRVETVQRRLLLSFNRFNILNFWPKLGKILFRKRWKELLQLRQNQEDILIPLIKSRIRAKQEQHSEENEGSKADGDEQVEGMVAYVDTLVNLQLPEEKRKLNDGEMVSLCSEFLSAGTDTTSTALQWIMANLVKYPHVQAKLYGEISSVVGSPPAPPSSKKGEGKGEETMRTVEEEDLQRMPYLKAVVLEGLRRHPPGHFVLPHCVTEEVELEGYVVPKNATVNFMVAEMGWDSEVWDDPMGFKPERFLTAAATAIVTDEIHGKSSKDGGGGEATATLDITGSRAREIKMMPFGAGRRICPASGLALLHLEYFVANLIWYFKWAAAGGEDGDDVDLSEKQEFTVVMKHPLQARITPRDECYA